MIPPRMETTTMITSKPRASGDDPAGDVEPSQEEW